MKPNVAALTLLNKSILNYQAYARICVDKAGDEDKTSKEFQDWDVATFYTYRSLFFNLITGEEDFDKFYDSFKAPADIRSDKPLAWGPRFWPDLMDDAIWSKTLTVEKKVEEIKALYEKCKKARRAFLRKKILVRKV